MQRECERSVRDDAAIDSALDRVFPAMDGYAKRGVNTTGVLPGGLGVRRRAHGWHEQRAAEDPQKTAEFSERYKETAGGGLAITVAVNTPEC